MEKAVHFIEARNLRNTSNELLKEAMKDMEVQAFLKKNEEKLTKEIVAKSGTKLYEFVREKQKRLNGEANRMGEDFYPQLCIKHRYIDVEYLPTQEHIAWKEEQKIRACIQSFDIPIAVRNATLADVKVTDHKILAIKAMNDFLKNYYNHPQSFHKGFYLYGDFGRGKSFLLGAFANELAKKGTNVVMVHFPSFIEEMKAAIQNNQTQEKLNTLKKATILILDDIGAESNTEWTRDAILGILLQYRMQENLPTFFTANQSFAELEEHLATTKTSDARLKAKRIMERIKYLANAIQIGGSNLRNPEEENGR